MATSYDPYHLASPTIYLIKMVIFLILVALVGVIISTQIITFFWANPFINSLIFFVAFVGVLLSFRQVVRLFPEVKWVNSLQDGTMQTVKHPVIGDYTMPAWPVRFAGKAPAVTAAPLLGANNVDVLESWLGKSADQVAALKTANAI